MRLHSIEEGKKAIILRKYAEFVLSHFLPPPSQQTRDPEVASFSVRGAEKVASTKGGGRAANAPGNRMFVVERARARECLRVFTH